MENCGTGMIRLNRKGCEFDCKDGGFIPESRKALCCNFLSEMMSIYTHPVRYFLSRAFPLPGTIFRNTDVLCMPEMYKQIPSTVSTLSAVKILSNRMMTGWDLEFRTFWIFLSWEYSPESRRYLRKIHKISFQTTCLSDFLPE